MVSSAGGMCITLSGGDATGGTSYAGALSEMEIMDMQILDHAMVGISIARFRDAINGRGM